MANISFGSGNTGFVDARRSSAANAGSSSHPETEVANGNLRDTNSMRTRLAAINGTYYTTARLDSMTHNDLIYALRVHGADTGAGIKKSGNG